MSDRTLKITNETTRSLTRGSRNDIIFTLKITDRQDSQMIKNYTLISPILDMNRTSTDKSTVFDEARAALDQIRAALDALEKYED